jgi:hypothetical protein
MARTSLPLLTLAASLACSNRLDVGVFNRPALDAGGGDLVPLASDANADVGPEVPPPRDAAAEIPSEAAGMTSMCNGGGRISVSTPQAVPAPQSGVVIRSLLSAGESTEPTDGGAAGTGYRLGGLPHGLGAFVAKQAGYFELLVNHDLASTAGATRAHGSPGAFVSRWIVAACDLSVLAGEDLIKTVQTRDSMSGAFQRGPIAFGQFRPGNLPPAAAFQDPGAGLGFPEPFFLNGEAFGPEGRAWAHETRGTSWELPALGKMAFTGLSARPVAAVETVVLEVGSEGTLHVYVGKKTAAGSPIDRAGLTGGTLGVVVVAGLAGKEATPGIPSGTKFSVAPVGSVETLTGMILQVADQKAGVTRFGGARGGAWDPGQPNDFYFVAGNSGQLWRLRFTDARVPAAGGTIDLLLDGSEEPAGLSSVTVDRKGHAYLHEGPGIGNPPPRIWRYDIATDRLVQIAQVKPAMFLDQQVAQSVGMIDASEFLGAGWFLLSVQLRSQLDDPQLGGGGQLLALFDPEAAL